MILRSIIVFFAGSILAAKVLAEAPLYHVGFAQDNLSNDWRLAQVRLLEQALSIYPDIQFSYTDGRGSTARQIRDIEDYIQREVDILIASPRDSRAMAPVISNAYKQGIAVILLTREVANDDYSVFIAPDDAAIARAAARDLASALKQKGRILVLQGVPTASTAVKRTEAFVDELKHYPDISIAAIVPANYLRSDAIHALEDALQGGLEFDAIYAQSDSMASGARLALVNANIDPASLPIVGIDYISEAREAIRQGTQHSSYVYPTCATEAAKVVRDLLDGRPVPKRILVNTTRVSHDNVEHVDPIF